MIQRCKQLCRGEVESIARWLNEPGSRVLITCFVAIIAGCGLYGFTVGWWRAPRQSLFTAIKFPLLIFLTCAGNALLNGMLAQLLGSKLSFRQTSRAILMSFAIAAVILGALSPITLFVLYNAPPLESKRAIIGHSVMLLTHVFVIAYAGVVANRRLFRLLEQLCGTTAIARRVLFCWLTGNLFLGAQLAWVLRPFIGSPHLAVQFLRADPLRGNFYEAVFHAARHLIF